MTLGELFAGIANAIRLKDGTTASIPATTFPERIMALSVEGGGGGSQYVVTSAGDGSLTDARSRATITSETSCVEGEQ